VWLEANGLEPRFLTPIRSLAILDEIQPPGAGLQRSRLNLMAGNDVMNVIGGGTRSAARSRADRAVAGHAVYSGSLGRYSNALQSVIENRQRSWRLTKCRSEGEFHVSRFHVSLTSYGLQILSSQCLSNFPLT